MAQMVVGQAGQEIFSVDGSAMSVLRLLLSRFLCGPSDSNVMHYRALAAWAQRRWCRGIVVVFFHPPLAALHL